MLWAAMVGLGFRGEVQIQNLTITRTSPSPYAGDERKFLLKALVPCSSRNSAKFGGRWIASSDKCPELSVYFYSVQNLWLHLYIFLKPHFCLTESRISGKALLRLGGMLCHGNSKQRGYMRSFFSPSVCRVLPWRANWVLSRRYSSLIWRYESIASNHLPCRAAAVKQDVW